MPAFFYSPVLLFCVRFGSIAVLRNRTGEFGCSWRVLPTQGWNNVVVSVVGVVGVDSVVGLVL